MAILSQLLEAPNGGWGWMVVFGSQLNNMFILAVISIFGLMFGPHLSSMNESESRIALVMNLRSAFLNLTGLLTAPVMKNFSPRIVAIVGSLLVSVGLMLSSMTTTLNQMIFTYSLLVGIGLGLSGPAIFMAVSSYFTTKRSRAFGFSMAGTGFGQMILPQLVRVLNSEYGIRGTVLIVASLSLHGVVGASLFHPVKWHMKNKEVEAEKFVEANQIKIQEPSKSLLIKEPDKAEETFWTKLSKTMDLSLLNDPRFALLNFGIACVYTVSTDFNLILPFYLQKTANLNRSQTATCMSIVAAFDLVSRLTFHIFTDRLKLSHRSIFAVGTLMMCIFRGVLAELTDYTALMITCGLFGYFRAFTIVNQTLSISEFCTKFYPEKLAGAIGLNMIIKGIAVVTLGQLLGQIRDITSSYSISLHSQNVLLSIVMIVWIIEYFCFRKT